MDTEYLKEQLVAMNNIAASGINAGREMAEREAAAKLKKLTEERNDLLAELEALLDIWDDQRNEPESRCYVPGAFTDEIETARALLAKHAPKAKDPA